MAPLPSHSLNSRMEDRAKEEKEDGGREKEREGNVKQHPVCDRSGVGVKLMIHPSQSVHTLEDYVAWLF